MLDWKPYATLAEYAATAPDSKQVLLHSADWGHKPFKLGSIFRGKLFTIDQSFAFDYVNNPPVHWCIISPPVED